MAWDHRSQPPPSQRGYDKHHREARERWAKIVKAGTASCTRCGQPVLPSQRWHLDHSDVDRSRYIGVAHAICNVVAAAKKARAVQTGTTFGDRQAISREW
jgi:hypothetical protein